MSSNERRPITLRPSTDSDTPFLLEVYTEARAEELAMSGWDAEQQRVFIEGQFRAQDEEYRRRFPQAAFDVILDGDRPIGRLYVARSSDEIRVLDLTLLVSDRNRGIGSELLRRLVCEAESVGKPVRIYVEKFGKSLSLFQRLGFRETEDAGMHLLMEWRGERSC